MKPLWFLTFRTFVNGIKRALGSPTRLIGILFFFGYYFMWFIRPAMQRGIGGRPGGNLAGSIEFPPMEIVWAVAFALFAVLSVFMMLGGMTQQGGFKPADVDILFPTPLPPRIVLLFRIARDYLFTLIAPLVFMVFGFGGVRAGYEWLFRNMPEQGQANQALRMAFVSWGLMALGWVCVNYAISLFINRSDTNSDRNRRVFGWCSSAFLLGAIGFIAYRSVDLSGPRELLDLAQEPFLKAVFFSASLATALTIGTLEGELVTALLGAAGLAAIIVVALRVAMSQAAWMYDQAAVKGFGNQQLKAAQRSGDTLAAIAALAQEGKIKPRRLRWIYNLKLTGPFALLWKDLFLQVRGMLWILIMIGLIGVFMSALPAMVPFRASEGGSTGMLLFMQGMSILMVTISIANVGFLELLRRIDLQKPLPFTPATIVTFEVLSKSLLGIVVSIVGSLVAAAIRPDLLPMSAASIIFSPALSVLLSSCVFLVIILFPDVDDQAQRQFRGIMMMLSIAVTGFPPVAVFLLLALGLSVPSWLAAFVGASICVGIAFVLILISGRLYANFNPSE